MKKDARQWVSSDGGIYQVTEAPRVPRLPAGMYDVGYSMQNGTFLQKADMRKDPLIRFPGSPTDDVLNDIEVFWERAEAFKAHEIPHKRGILLHGPPGSGKTCAIQLIARGVVERGGIVIMWNNRFLGGYRLVRFVEPDRHIVVMMEDLDNILSNNDESDVLNILDGAENMHRVVFVSSTNYMERLEERVANRPSRFDRRVLIPHPNEEGRRMYLETLLRPGDTLDVAKYAKDTDGFSMAHIKELFVGTVLLGNDYDRWLKQLQRMQDKIKSTDYSEWDRGQYA